MHTARELSISFYDSLYVQLALDHGLTFLSADSQLLSKAEKKLRPRGWNLEDV